jgi:predicted PurR-regulated permease PerM
VALGLVAGFLVIGTFLWLALPGVIAQLTELAEDAPQLLEQAQRNFPLLGDVSERIDLSQRLQSLSSDLPGILLGLAGSATSLVLGSLTVLVLTIYLTVNLPRMRAAVAGLLHPEDREEFEQILGESIRRVGGYVQGNIVISLIAGVVSFIALSLIGVKFAAALAFIVALLDLIPTIGAILAAVVATLVAALTGVGDMIATLAFFLAYQQVENYLIQPRVMRSAIDMSAPVVIVSVLIGGALLGVIGALLALPVAAIVKVTFRELYLEDRREAVRRADG